MQQMFSSCFSCAGSTRHSGSGCAACHTGDARRSSSTTVASGHAPMSPCAGHATATSGKLPAALDATMAAPAASLSTLADKHGKKFTLKFQELLRLKTAVANSPDAPDSVAVRESSLLAARAVISHGSGSWTLGKKGPNSGQGDAPAGAAAAVAGGIFEQHVVAREDSTNSTNVASPSAAGRWIALTVKSVSSAKGASPVVAAAFASPLAGDAAQRLPSAATLHPRNDVVALPSAGAAARPFAGLRSPNTLAAPVHRNLAALQISIPPQHLRSPGRLRTSTGADHRLAYMYVAPTASFTRGNKISSPLARVSAAGGVFSGNNSPCSGTGSGHARVSAVLRTHSHGSFEAGLASPASSPRAHSNARFCSRSVRAISSPTAAALLAFSCEGRTAAAAAVARSLYQQGQLAAGMQATHAPLLASFASMAAGSNGPLGLHSLTNARFMLDTGNPSELQHRRACSGFAIQSDDGAAEAGKDKRREQILSINVPRRLSGTRGIQVPFQLFGGPGTAIVAEMLGRCYIDRSPPQHSRSLPRLGHSPTGSGGGRPAKALHQFSRDPDTDSSGGRGFLKRFSHSCKERDREGSSPQGGGGRSPQGGGGCARLGTLQRCAITRWEAGHDGRPPGSSSNGSGLARMLSHHFLRETDHNGCLHSGGGRLSMLHRCVKGGDPDFSPCRRSRPPSHPTELLPRSPTSPPTRFSTASAGSPSGAIRMYHSARTASSVTDQAVAAAGGGVAAGPCSTLAASGSRFQSPLVSPSYKERLAAHAAASRMRSRPWGKHSAHPAT